MKSAERLTTIDQTISARYTPLLATFLAIALPLVFVLQVLPFVGNLGASVIPASWERRLGVYILQEISVNNQAKTQVATQQVIRESLQRLLAHTSLQDVQLEFIKGPPNAFALPGNILVLTDDLLLALKNRDQFDAVMAHELGHLASRDVLKNVLGSGLLALLVKGISGDFSGESAIAGLLTDLVLHPSFSKATETRADTFSHQLLIKTARSPEHFAQAMDEFGKYIADLKFSEGSGYFASHPPTATRAEAARVAAKRAGFAPLPSAN
jgi:beta-barrel assembly-enhancing protease